jgi:hypothetical protein
VGSARIATTNSSRNLSQLEKDFRLAKAGHIAILLSGTAAEASFTQACQSLEAGSLTLGFQRDSMLGLGHQKEH